MNYELKHLVHGTVHGMPVESFQRVGPTGEVTTRYVTVANSAYSESDARALLKALASAVEAAWPGKRCLDEALVERPCRDERWAADSEAWCRNCRANGEPLPPVEKP